MDARGKKRKHIEMMENEFTAECTKMENDSENLNKDIKAAREDFALMCKSMNDRHAELLTHGLFLEEQHRRVIDVLDGRLHGQGVESFGGNETLNMGTIADVKKLARDTDKTLRDHRIIREIEIQEMEKVFEQYKDVLKQNIVVFRERAEGIEKQRRELSPKLIQFARSAVEETASG